MYCRIITCCGLLEKGWHFLQRCFFCSKLENFSDRKRNLKLIIIEYYTNELAWSYFREMSCSLGAEHINVKKCYVIKLLI